MLPTVQLYILDGVLFSRSIVLSLSLLLAIVRRLTILRLSRKQN